MSPHFLAELRRRGPAIEGRWRTLLRIEPVPNPLANPEALQYMIPEAWVRVMATLEKPPRHRVSLQKARAQVPDCSCGNNPYRAFYTAAEQAITEAAVMVQAEQAAKSRNPEELAEIVYVVRCLARSEIDTFCNACVHHGKAANCRFALAH